MTHFRIPPKKDIWTAVGFLVLTAVLARSCVWVWKQYLTTPPYVDPERYPVRGIDVSSHNGDLNLREARKDGIDFIFIKASEGADFKDKNFVTNHAKAQKAEYEDERLSFFRFDKDGVGQGNEFFLRRSAAGNLTSDSRLTSKNKGIRKG